ncbi:MAG: glycosyl transferase [Thermus sp.]
MGFFEGVLLFLLFRLGIALTNLVLFPVLRPTPTRPPLRVSLLIPARNEAHRLQETLPRFLRQGADEVLLLDDQSEDGTLELALRLGGGTPGFQALKGRPLPRGWVGKNWACHQLAEKAKGEVLVFVDADVEMEEGALSALIARYRGGLLSAFPRQKAGSLLELATVPFVMDGLLSFLPYPLLPHFPAANGQVMVLSREAYERLGGHRAVRSSPIEDVALARLAKRRGLPMDLVLGDGLLKVRMYRGYLEAVEGFGKNFLPLHGHWTILLGSAFFHLALYTLPWAYGLWGLGVLGILERLLIAWKTGGPLGSAFLTPLSPVLLIPIYLRALLRPRWKGRVL